MCFFLLRLSLVLIFLFLFPQLLVGERSSVDECGCDDDEICLVRLLLSNTKLRVNANGTLFAEFQSFLGAFQGDCLSGYLAGTALREAAMSQPNLPITKIGLPLVTLSMLTTLTSMMRMKKT